MHHITLHVLPVEDVFMASWHAESIFIVRKVLGKLMISWDDHVRNLSCNVLDLVHEIVALPSIILKKGIEKRVCTKCGNKTICDPPNLIAQTSTENVGSKEHLTICNLLHSQLSMFMLIQECNKSK